MCLGLPQAVSVLNSQSKWNKGKKSLQIILKLAPEPTQSVNRTQVHHDSYDGDHFTTHVFIMQRPRQLLCSEEMNIHHQKNNSNQ